MKTFEFTLPLSVGLLSAVILDSSCFAQGTLIGLSTRNGSFENGALAPWGSGHDVRVLHDPAFASQGAYYASFQSALVLPVSIGQNLTPNPSEGLVFFLSFDARMGTPGLDIVTPLMGGRTPGGDPLSASVTAIAAPPLSISTWRPYQYQLQMPADWDNAGFTFGILFSKNEPLGGTTHIAYLDNVILQQLPEPTPVALLAIAGLVLAARRVPALPRRRVHRSR